MTQYRPPSKQGIDDPDLDTLHAEVMPWMVNPLINWLDPFLWIRQPHRNRLTNDDFVDGLEMALRLRVPLSRKHQAAASKDVENRIREGGTFGLDVASYAVYSGRVADAETLNWLLHEAGSAWEVTPVPGTKSKKVYLLTRRDLTAAKAAIADLRQPSAERPAQFLSTAWTKIATRNPDPSGAYDNAIKAVEAAAHLVISPKNGRATLGTMIKDIETKPNKWAFVLGADMAPIASRSQALWRNHFRHGTQPRDDHTLEEADAAVHLAIPLVRYFAGGLVAAA